MLVTFIIISSSDLESIFRSCIGSGDDWMFQAYFSAGLTRTAKPKKTKYVQLLFLYTYFIFDNWNVYIWHSRSSPNYMALLLELLVALEWQFWSLPWEMWTMTRSKAVPMSKVPPKPNRRPYNTGIATSKGPFWYGGTRTCSTIRSRSRHVRSLTNTHTAQTGQTHLPSQRIMGAFLSSFNLNEAPRRLTKWTGDNYILGFLTVLGNITCIARVLILRSNELEACPRPPNLICHLI